MPTSNEPMRKPPQVAGLDPLEYGKRADQIVKRARELLRLPVFPYDHT